MKKISDRQRLNFLERLHRESAQQEWVAVLYDGMLVLDEPIKLADGYDTLSKPRPKIRQAIDAAIKAEKKK